MQHRFEADPMLKSTELLLQERVPKTAAPTFPHAEEAGIVRSDRPDVETVLRIFKNPNSPSPDVHLLSNGRYHVMVSSAGGGYSKWRDLAVTRWREDPTRDCWGSFCYIKDVQSGQVWSTAYQPTLKNPASYEAIFNQGMAEFKRRDQDYETYSQLSVSPEDDIELCRVTIRNYSSEPRTLEITTYSEVVLAPPAAEAAHPDFANLFVQTQILPERHAILCTRRPRRSDEVMPWMIHLLTVEGDNGPASFETDRG